MGLMILRRPGTGQGFGEELIGFALEKIDVVFHPVVEQFRKAAESLIVSPRLRAPESQGLCLG